jgi:glycerophosphoryl diester phosphodiesterase
MKTRNIAHRGARSLAPENTLAALQKAWEIGADGIEVDVRVSADGRLVIHHDKTPARTTNASECFPDRASHPLTTFQLEELETLDAGSWFIDSDPFSQISNGTISFAELERLYTLRIPTLEEVLLFVKNKQWWVNLELKKVSRPQEDFPLAEAVLSVIEQVHIDPDQVALSSFFHPYLIRIQQLRPDIEVQALIGSRSAGRNDWGKYTYQTYNANQAYIDQAQVHIAMEHGCRVNLYTVNDPVMMRTYIDWGISSLITDYPQTLQKVLEHRSADRKGR